MIRELTLKFGGGPAAPTGLSIPLTSVTIFVGPNNSGKTRVLHELRDFISDGNEDANRLVLKSLELEGLSEADAKALIQRESVQLPPGVVLNRNFVRLKSGGGGTHDVDARMLLENLQSPNRNKRIVCNWYLTHHTVMLDGPSRISLINQTPIGDLQSRGENPLQRLFRDDSLRAIVRTKIHEAFGEYLVLDPTKVGSLRLKLSKIAPPSDEVERGIDARAVSFHGQARDIQQYSDGVKAYTGILATITAADPQVILIDEPEAFLHPALAFKLGNDIASSAGPNKRVFVATHSPEFLMGCIQSGASVNVVRLTYRGGVATARLLPNSQLLRLMRNPLLRSTGVLAGLFYEFVVVTEADADRAFYQEINERLLRFDRAAGAPNTLFLNAQNWQTVHQIIQPLRALGIPAAAIVDIDVLKSGTDFTRLLTAASVPEVNRPALGQLRSSILDAVEKAGRDWKREGGIDVLGKDTREAADNLFDQLEEYGIFVVRQGELESWLKDLGARGHGPSWLVSVFERMGEDPSQENYLKPGRNNVWAFMGRISKWLLGPTRKGVPE